MKKILVFGSSGQMCNQLFFYAHLISFGSQYNFKIINPAFYRYAKYFSGTSQNAVIQYPLKTNYFNYNSRIQILILFIFKFLAELNVFYTIRLHRTRYLFYILSKLKLYTNHDLAKKLFLDEKNYDFERYGRIKEKMIGCNTILINGYMFTAEDINKHKSKIRKYFRLTDHYINFSNRFLKDVQSLGKVFIGIHIRRKDYKTYKNGMYYFKDSVYRNYADKVATLIKERTVFIICSDDYVNELEFNGLTYVISKNCAVVDLDILSKCQYILGVPSSFNSWASFIGETPMYHIISETVPEIRLEDFSIYYD